MAVDLIKLNQRRTRGSRPFNPADWPSQPGSHPPHKWQMLDGHVLYTCEFCGINALDAFEQNIETFGEGPCPKNNS